MENGALYELEDVKIMIIYTLTQINKPIPTKHLIDMFLNTDVVDYFTLSQALNELEKTGHIAEDSNEGITVLTRLGYEGAAELYTKLPIYVRERAVKGAVGLLAKVEREAGVITKTEYDNKNYTTTCILKDGDDTLIKLELTMPSMEMAREIENKFKENSADIYRTVIEKLS